MRLIRENVVRIETDAYRIKKLQDLGYIPEGEEKPKEDKENLQEDEETTKDPETKPEGAKEEAKDEAKDEKETFDVEKLTNAKLVELLAEQGVKAPANATKKELLEIYWVNNK